MIEVPLYGQKAAGRVALIDDEDLEIVAPYRWNVYEHVKPNGRRQGPYAVVSVYEAGQRSVRRMHSLITGWPLTDHADHDGLNNQRSNLRPGIGGPNNWNTRPNIGSASKYKGVSRNRVGRWRARIFVAGLESHLGSFGTEEEAALAYDAAARQSFGEFAWLNFPDR